MSYGPGHKKMSYIICEQQRRRCHMGQVMRKCVLCHMGTTKTQMSYGPGHEKMRLMSYVNNKGADVIWARS